MELALGSQDPFEGLAVAKAARQLGLWPTLYGTVPDPIIAASPMGFMATRYGAQSRAKSAKRAHPHAVAIGIQSGLRRGSDGWEEWSIVNLILLSGQEIEVISEPTPVPTDAVEEVQKLGSSKVTLSSVLSRLYHATLWDWHRVITRGERSRSDILAKPLASAFQLMLAETV